MFTLIHINSQSKHFQNAFVLQCYIVIVSLQVIASVQGGPIQIEHAVITIEQLLV